MKYLSRRYMHETLDVQHGDIPLLISVFLTGLLDAATYNKWGVFVGMQTGNTIILALATADLPAGHRYSALPYLLSLASFLVGAFVTFLVSRHVNRHSRVFLACVFLAQGVCLVGAAIPGIINIVTKGPEYTISPSANVQMLIELALLALQFGMQMASARILGFTELPTVMVTASYVDTMGDLFTLKWDAKRMRRTGSIVLMLAGGIVGAWMMKMGFAVTGHILIAAGLKILLAVGIWMIMPKQKEELEMSEHWKEIEGIVETSRKDVAT